MKHFKALMMVEHPSHDSLLHRRYMVALSIMGLLLAILACSRPGQDQIIYVTATFPGGERVLTGSPTPSEPTNTPIQPTPNATRSNVTEGVTVDETIVVEQDGTYTIQAGDTLAVIAASLGVTVDDLIAANGITNPNRIEVGQVLIVPTEVAGAVANATPVPTTAPQSGSSFKILPDSEVVYSPAVAEFNVVNYLKVKEGFIRAYSQEIGGEYRLGVEIIDEVAKNYSINPRLLLALLEYRSKWLSETVVTDDAEDFPYGLYNAGRTGLYRQVLDAANAINAGYYGWKYRGLNQITFADGRTVNMAPDLNPGTAAVQYFLSRFNTYEQWLVDVGEGGFFQLYLSLFGDPFRSAFEPMVPANLTQPVLTFPFPANETWYFTGGPHGGYNNGSAWASIDFAPPAPPDDLLASQGFCYVSPYWVTAVAPGVIARSGGGFVILDLDFDGNEYTGWTIVYLHIADDEDLIEAGTTVTTGDRLGHPSCEGGFSSATHLHIGRRYNGEWIPVDCFNCAPETPHAPMVFSGWTVGGYENAEYQGFMDDGQGGFRRAEQGREDPINELRYDK